jgi:hypothetical protein
MRRNAKKSGKQAKCKRKVKCSVRKVSGKLAEAHALSEKYW